MKIDISPLPDPLKTELQEPTIPVPAEDPLGRPSDPIEQILDADPSLLQEPHTHPLLRHLHRATVTRWIQKARLPAVKVGRKWFITDQVVRDFLKSTSKAAQQARVSPDRTLEIAAAFQAIGMKCPD